jgi:putative ubiquitin-RnfH superfamily antitoxin RatB of RatAB toxin-antitoxin module
MATEPDITVTVVYSAKARDVVEEPLRLKNGCTVAQALLASGFDLPKPAKDGPGADYGIWGKKVGLTHVLRDQDRLEVYRPLMVDPKVARRERFAGQGAKKAAGLFAKRREGSKAGY